MILSFSPNEQGKPFQPTLVRPQETSSRCFPRETVSPRGILLPDLGVAGFDDEKGVGLRILLSMLTRASGRTSIRWLLAS